MTAGFAADTASRAYRGYVLCVLTVAYVFAFVDRQILSILVEPMKASLSLSDTQIGLVHGLAFAVTYSVLALPIARLADRGHRVGIVAAGVGTWSAATALLGLARDFAGAFACRVGVGAGEAAIAPAAISILTDYFDRSRRAIALGVFVAGGPVGASLALLLGGALLEHYSRVATDPFDAIGLPPWSGVLVTLGVVPGVVLFLLLLGVREPRRARGSTSAAVPWPTVWEFVRTHRRLVACHLAGMALFTLVAYALASWGPALFMRHFEWSAGRTGLVLGLSIGIAGGAGAVLGGVVAAALQRRGRTDAALRTVVIGIVGLLAPAVLAPLVASATVSLALFAVCLFFINFPSGPSLVAIQDVTPGPMRAQLTAVYFVALGIVGMGLGGVSVGLLADHVYAEARALRHALATVAAGVLPVAALLVAAALAPFREARDARRSP